MYHIIYHSVAVGQPTTDDLRFLLRQSRRNNAGLGITGLLLYGNGRYLQVLEGLQMPLEHLFSVIKQDCRHSRVAALSAGPIQKRVFATWSMGFQKLSDENFVRLTGYVSPCRFRFLEAHPPEMDEGLRILLGSFVNNEGLPI
ncbi:hypothetical protein CDA63_05115 [Hymenobacter amundsenii]|uniref:BLUF domain-containing protein n=1 Tax=Hymenobacter amundsenii TaxID=2006685 RepID=A0A246FMZ9_9BACT|nr:BLUF domain-containing protein [Hymenobacter amundsenii]OWP64111.1 hypothetical protein CDA63_05115 [Hymenobacter amundsenii]